MQHMAVCGRLWPSLHAWKWNKEWKARSDPASFRRVRLDRLPGIAGRLWASAIPRRCRSRRSRISWKKAKATVASRRGPHRPKAGAGRELLQARDGSSGFPDIGIVRFHAEKLTRASNNWYKKSDPASGNFGRALANAAQSVNGRQCTVSSDLGPDRTVYFQLGCGGRTIDVVVPPGSKGVPTLFEIIQIKD